jgi:hypothetical protein
MVTVANARPKERAKFIQNTYLHLSGAVIGFIIVEYLFFQTGIAETLFNLAVSTRFAWFAFLGIFSLLGWLSRELTSKANEINLQYFGLGIYVLGEALIFAPMLYVAQYYTGDPNLISTAAILTLFMFGGLTTVAFTTKQDFYFLGSILKVGAWLALGLIICSILFGFQLGIIFSGAMVGFACAAILYDTSNIIYRYRSSQYVAASLQLFASVALLFYYVVSILIKLNSRN